MKTTLGYYTVQETCEIQMKKRDESDIKSILNIS